MAPRLNSAKTRKLRMQAVDWLLLMEEGELSSHDRATLEAWLGESPAHGEALEAARGLYRDAGLALAVDHEETKKKIGENGNGMARGGGILTCLVAAGGLFWLAGGPLYLQADVISDAGEKPVVVLADGSRVHLNSGSAIAHEMSGNLRRVKLLKGEAFFEVAKDAARPFIVEAAGGRVEVLGTAFNVNLVPGRTEVTVTENRVRVSTQPGQSATLTPGMRVSYDPQGRLEPVQTVPTGMETPWLAGRLVFEERPMAQVVAEIARYMPGKVTIASTELAERRISGSFDLSDPEAAFASFAGVFGLRTIRAGSLLTIIY